MVIFLDDKIDLNLTNAHFICFNLILSFLSNDTLIKSINLSFLDNTFYLGKIFFFIYFILFF